MIKVLFLIHDLGEGGAEKVLVNLVNNMNHKKFDITLIALFGGGVNEQFLSKNIRYKAIFRKSIPGNSKLMKLFSPKLLHKLFIKETYDIEVSYLEGPSARIISGCQNKKTKLVSWIHVEQHTEKLAAKAFRNFKESVKCYQNFDQTVCVSESVKEDYLKIYPMIQKVDVLYNTNETEKIIDLMNEVVEPEFYEEDVFRLCGVGKIMPVKGFDKLARIHKRLIDEGYKVHTYVLGMGPQREEIEKYLQENHLEDSFTFLGYQTNPYKYVAKCDLFVCTSSAEGFSTAATEALIVGTPVVTTPVAGMREMLGANNEYGIVAELQEDSVFKNIKILLESPKLMQEYRERTKIRGKDFSKEKTVIAVEALLEKL